jgi:Cu2+-exporting ATPase
VIAENLAWATVYNVLAIPLAAIGMIPPYWAAAGMSVSSLVVVANALRLSAVRVRPSFVAPVGESRLRAMESEAAA